MKKKIDRPIIVYVPEEDNDRVIEWGKNNEALFHTAVVEGVVELLKKPKLTEVIIVEFFNSQNDRFPWSDIYVDRTDLKDSLLEAENYFVSVEDYEKAQWVKNYRDTF